MHKTISGAASYTDFSTSQKTLSSLSGSHGNQNGSQTRRNRNHLSRHARTGNADYSQTPVVSKIFHNTVKESSLRSKSQSSARFTAGSKLSNSHPSSIVSSAKRSSTGSHLTHQSKKTNSIQLNMPKLQQLLNFSNHMESVEATKAIRQRASSRNTMAPKSGFGF